MSNEAIGRGAEAAILVVQTNEAAENRLLVFRRGLDGALTPAGAARTGGAGEGVPHLTSQGSIAVTGDGRLLVTNAGSGDVSLFEVKGGEVVLVGTTPTGAAPKSIAEHRGLVYVLHTGDASLAAFRLGDTGLTALPDSVRSLPGDTDPAQIGFSPDGSALVVTLRGTNSIVTAEVIAEGRLGDPEVRPSSGPTPHGFAISNQGILVVTEASGGQEGKAAASSYAVRAGSSTPVTRSLGNGRTAACWAVITGDGRYAFTTNWGDGTLSRYAIAADGGLMLEQAVAGVAVAGKTGPRDLALTEDGRFLYTIDPDAGRIFGFAVGEGGALSPVGSWDGLPPTAAGLASRAPAP